MKEEMPRPSLHRVGLTNKCCMLLIIVLLAPLVMGTGDSFAANYTTSKSQTFALKTDLERLPSSTNSFVDFVKYLYSTQPVMNKDGRLLIITNPETEGRQCIYPLFSNGFIGALHTAYNHHRHLIIRPDDVWIAITTAFSLFINGGDKAEEMRHHFVDFEGKMKLQVGTNGASLYDVDWNALIDQMSVLIDVNTKDDVKQWIEADFSTTTPVMKTVSKVVLMGILQNYFEYDFVILCGLPNVTLEGTLADWQRLRQKAVRLGHLNDSTLSHWAELLDIVLANFEESYKGQVDKDFWGNMITIDDWGSGPSYIEGWANVFMPFNKDGVYQLQRAQPEKGFWGKTDSADVPPSTVEVPVKINDNGKEYDTMFYGGHFICTYGAKDDSVRPSIDWAMIDITEDTRPKPSEEDELWEDRTKAFPKPQMYVDE